jgi:ATP-dependent DNA helicase DinG
VLDRRLVTKRYGQAFLATLPRTRLLRTVEEARAWWDVTEDDSIAGRGM